MINSSFAEKAFQIVPAENLDKLYELKNFIYQTGNKILNKSYSEREFFDGFHQLGLTGTKVNDFRTQLISEVSKAYPTGTTILQCFQKTIEALVGADIVAQKTTNVVIHQPEELDFVPVHRDAPLNSYFEVVVWLPLSDSYGTKSMYVLDYDNSLQALQILQDSGGDYDLMSKFSREKGTNLEVKFGEAVFFWPGLVHGCHINKESETRWTLNMRYKNLFSPLGAKGLPEFFELLKLSPLTQTAYRFLGEKINS